MPRSVYNVFVCNGDVYSSPNSTTMPSSIPLPSGFLDSPDCSYTPSDAMTFRWASNHFPFIPFIPSPIQLEGRLLGRLSFISSTLPIERYKTFWRLSPSLQDSWRALESFLQHVNATLTRSSWFNLEAEPFPSPESYGYLGNHFTEEKARRSCMISRDAFFPLIGQCTYSIASRPGETDHVPNWYMILESVGKVHPLWLDFIKESVICDLTARRIGVMIDPSQCNWLRSVSTLLNANVKVWFYWGTTTARITPKDSVVAKYCPSEREVLTAQFLASSTFPNAPEIKNPTSPSDSLACFPDPQHLSGQKKGEHWKQFFERREERNKEKMVVESATERQRRLGRAENAERKTCPGKNSHVVVFEWEDVNGFLIRKRVNRGNIEDTWRDYGPSHKRFDSFANEWDLCHDFDPNPNALTDDDIAYQFESGQPHTPEPPIHLPLPSSPTPPPPSSQPPENDPLPASRWHDDLLAAYDMSIPMSQTDAPALDDMLYRRYGFSPDAPSRQHAIDQSAYKAARLSFGHPKDDLPKEYLSQFMDFFQQLVKENPQIPTSLWDHTEENSGYIFRQLTSGVQLQVQKCLDGRRLYIIVAGGHSKWSLGTWEAATALQCLRVEGKSPSAIARSLLEYGTPFLTLKPSSSLCAAPPRPSFTLGWRRQCYQPDVKDYAAYVHLRDSFFRQPHARAALLKGGIIWRLAIDSLNFADALAGPSEHVFDYGKCVRAECGDLWDDDLSVDELDLISGVYKVFTGQCSSFSFSQQPFSISW
jgi:hypothetical protein